MNFHEAKNLLVIVQERNLSKAATKTHMTQPALSKLVMKLEKMYDISIFDRTVHPWSLTYVGELLAKHARTILENEEALKRELEKARRKNKGRIVLGTMVFEEKYLLPSLLSNFYIGKHDYDVDIVVENPRDIEKSILSGAVTFATIINPVKSYGIKSFFLKEYEMIIAVPISFLKGKNYKYLDIDTIPEIDINIFKDYPFILRKPYFMMRDLEIYVCNQAGFVPKVAAEVVNAETALGLVSKSAGIAFIFDEILKYMLPKENVAYFRIKGIYPKQKIEFAFKETLEFTDVETSFLNVIKESAKNI